MTKAKKSLGQNFLHDQNILRKIADFAYIKPGDTVVEIGPGRGALTELLLDRVGEAGRVIAVEKDSELVPQLKDKFSRQITDNRLQIVESDILDYNLPTNNCLLVGNIPYYITGEIFRKFLSEAENPPQSLTFIVQREVADRIMARPARPNGRSGGDKKESVLSISVKAYGVPEYGGIIRAGSFSPVPKVDSAIIAVRNISRDRFKETDEGKFFRLLKRGFSHKRKLLRGNLGLNQADLEHVGIEPDARAEDIDIDDWFRLVHSMADSPS